MTKKPEQSTNQREQPSGTQYKIPKQGEDLYYGKFYELPPQVLPEPENGGVIVESGKTTTTKFRTKEEMDAYDAQLLASMRERFEADQATFKAN